MKLAIPLGLLGLIAIAFLILIYVFKPKYQDKKVSSTYIWKLSLKYAKRKVPFQWLKSSLLLIIQILILALIAFAMSFPQIVLSSTNGEKIAVLDASASMAAEYNGKSRFDRAKSEISAMIDQTTQTHKISVILAGGQASYLVSRTDSASFAKQKLFEAECSLSQADISGAMELAENVLAENPGAEVYLFTDCDYADSGKVKVVNVASSEWNAAVLNFSARRDKGKFIYTAEVAAYGKDAEISVGLKIDGKSQMPRLAECKDGETFKVVWDNLDISSYGRAEVHLNLPADGQDSFAYDNDFYIYSDNSESFKVQYIVNSDDKEPQLDFLYSALRSTEKCQITAIRYSSDPDVDINNSATEKYSGFDLYVYDNYVPDVTPSDGTVWVINPPSKTPASAFGITVGGTVKTNSRLSSSGSNSETAKALLNCITPSMVTVTEYKKITTYAGYESILQIDGDSALLVKNDNGLKTVVMPFDIHMSDLSMVPQFPLFINALCDFSMAQTIEKTIYEVGDTIKINAKADTDYMSVKAESVGGEEIFTTFPVELTAEFSGEYTVYQETRSGRKVNGSFFVRIAEGESVFGKTESVLVNPITPFGSGTDSNVANNTEDIIVYLIGALLVILCIEWGLQYREQY